MTKNLIKGGLHIIENEPLTTKLHKINNKNEINFIKAYVETEGTDGAKGDSLNAKKKYTLYRLFDITNYNDEKFILPSSITDIGVNKIYLFGLREKKFFVKNKKVKGVDINKCYDNIGKALKNLYSGSGSGNVEIILAHHEESKELYIFFVMNNKIKEDNFKFFENDFSPALFNNDNDLKKKIRIIIFK